MLNESSKGYIMLNSDKYGLIVDLETTGLDASKHEIIEIGLIEFKYSLDSQQCAIISSYGQLNQPKSSISEEITKITGITNDIVKDTAIDWGQVQKYFDRAEIVIAHNADFDRGFLANEVELDLEGVHWSCSCKHIDWHEKGFKSLALNYLAADHGFVNPFAHRALFDCATTYKVMSPYFAELYERSFEKEVRILAVGAPFDKKDLLKARKYRWNGEQKVWGKIITESSLEDERSFLNAEIYRNANSHVEEML